jgi:hypothetical protein
MQLVSKRTEASVQECTQKGKYKGLDNARDLLPPMPWQILELK